MNTPLSADISAALATGETIVLSETRTIPPQTSTDLINRLRGECRRALMDRASTFLLDGTTVVMQMAWDESPDGRPIFEGTLRSIEVRLYLKLLPDHPLVRRRSRS